MLPLLTFPLKTCQRARFPTECTRGESDQDQKERNGRVGEALLLPVQWLYGRHSLLLLLQLHGHQAVLHQLYGSHHAVLQQLYGSRLAIVWRPWRCTTEQCAAGNGLKEKEDGRGCARGALQLHRAGAGQPYTVAALLQCWPTYSGLQWTVLLGGVGRWRPDYCCCCWWWLNFAPATCCFQCSLSHWWNSPPMVIGHWALGPIPSFGFLFLTSLLPLCTCDSKLPQWIQCILCRLTPA